MKLGLIGMQSSGKTTVFSALSESQIDSAFSGSIRGDAHSVFIPVYDTRILELTDIYEPKKTTYAMIELFDFLGFPSDSNNREEALGKSMQIMRTMEGLALVLSNFTDSLTDCSGPEDELNRIETELELMDLISIEKRFEKYAWSRQRGRMTMEMEREEKVLQRAAEMLENETPLRKMELNADEEKLIRGFQFLSQKPLMIILNSDEDSFNSNLHSITQLEQKYASIEFAGKFEMELSSLEGDDQIMFMEDMGISMSARERLSRMAYATLGLISFFTVGSDEVKAWTIQNGDTALDAARTIHSDLARGFIKAKCFSYNDLHTLGSEKIIRANGLYRLESKSYVVPDGTIMEIKFNV